MGVILKSVFKSSLKIAAIFQLFITAFIFYDAYLGNEYVEEGKFRYSLYVSFLALQIFPFSLIIVLICKSLFAYFKK